MRRAARARATSALRLPRTSIDRMSARHAMHRVGTGQRRRDGGIGIGRRGREPKTARRSSVQPAFARPAAVAAASTGMEVPCKGGRTQHARLARVTAYGRREPVHRARGGLMGRVQRHCVACGVRPAREALIDERGEQATIGLGTCQSCSGATHAWGCNDPEPHDAPVGCSRDSRRVKRPIPGRWEDL